MQTILGKLNDTYLQNLLTQSYPACKQITAAIAYAGLHEPLIRHLEAHASISLAFYGLLDEDQAVSLQLLDWFLRKAPATASCHMVRGAYHPKVIWWHGYGAYIGSANLTTNGWQRNIECGVFLSEGELSEGNMFDDLELLFSTVHEASTPLTQELYAVLQEVSQARQGLREKERQFGDNAQRLLEPYKRFEGLIHNPAKGQPRRSKAEDAFVSEWRETLQLLRTLGRQFQALKKRPSWVSETANNTVHFDQFLHGYYYHYALKSVEEGNGMAKVGQLFARNQTRTMEALAESVDWWCRLPKAPSKDRYDEEVFIRERAPRMARLFSSDGLDAMTEDSFIEGMRSVAAFREHARQVPNVTYGLPADHKESEDARLERFARLVWQSRSEAGRGPLDVIRFIVHGTKPQDAERRLWLAQRDPTWKVRGLGRSILGEILGWAKPDIYPPRNDRTNKALRALGHDVVVFSQ